MAIYADAQSCFRAKRCYRTRMEWIMVIQTKLFGEIDIEGNRIITFSQGLIGLGNLKRFLLIYDSVKEEKPAITWLQSIEEPSFALPVMNPMAIIPSYNPVVEDELLDSIGSLEPENLIIMVALTVPSDLTKITANLKAPIIIQAETKRGCQLIVENEEYDVRQPIYEKGMGE